VAESSVLCASSISEDITDTGISTFKMLQAALSMLPGLVAMTPL
jgi:hypothetical protein